MDETQLLSLPYILPAQAQKHVTHNEALRKLDALVQIGVIDRTRTDAPASPEPGQRHIVPIGAAGVWGEQDNSIATWQDGAWEFFHPNIGWLAWVVEESALLVWDGITWAVTTRTDDRIATFGINTTADSTNRLSVKSDAILFSHDDVTPGSGSVRQVINKLNSSYSASIIFQTDYSGRAELGLTHDDNWQVKVSNDGSNWTDAITVAASNGYVGVGTNYPSAPVHVAGFDNGLVIENLSDVGAEWSITAGRPGIFEDHLIFSTGTDIGDFSTHQLRLRKNGAPTFVHGIAVADGERVESSTSGGTAYYIPYDGSGGELSFRAPENSGEAKFEIYGYTHIDGFERVDVAAFTAGHWGGRLGVNTKTPSTTLHVEGPIRIGQYNRDSLPDATIVGRGSLIYINDSSESVSIAFSDGVVWRHMSTGAVLS